MNHTHLVLVVFNNSPLFINNIVNILIFSQQRIADDIF